MQRYLRLLVICLSCPSQFGTQNASLLATARSEVESFLLRDGITPNSPSLGARVARCEEEEKRAHERHRQWTEMGQKSERLQAAWRSYRHKLIDGGMFPLASASPRARCSSKAIRLADELDRTMAHARTTSKSTALPQEHQEAIQWASIWFGQALQWVQPEGDPHTVETS